MPKFIIQGGAKLQGQIDVKGAKNNALKAIPATLLTEERVVLKNLPNIIDINLSIEILKDLGAKIEKLSKDSIAITAKNINPKKLNSETARKIRTSLMFVPPLLHRFKIVEIPHPGGCVIGKRPINFFLDFLRDMNVKIEIHNGIYRFINNGMRGCKYVFPKISHTGTEALIMAAVLSHGKTEIKNAACEPEVAALCEMLNQMGANIVGAGTHSITINGVKKLKSTEFTIIPDRIEAGSFLCIGIATRSNIKITKCDPSHLEIPIKILNQMGVNLEIGKNYIQIKDFKKLKPVDITTHEYPGFPTDLQSCYTVLLTQANGMSMMHETIYESRLFFTDFLSRMGAKLVLCDPHRVVINGPVKLSAKKMESPDIRAGLAMLIAGLIAQGETHIDNIQQIDRGYENIEKRLNKLGANIKREE
ncbi:MAG TPA: UDP-N-acetylglucosamine 1-carboxyvinyltransferase [bacterium]|jgi:UDP-N-acetylglucosamine 1-carboxyvinyltransferase|nr:UDP-N-acetylglucosamine 1-carboxyvinyltransferase [bacterium]HOG38044.1 UDP-N-acetylglucosamine 1-carboxyvinyltransferase [bacterium]